MKSEHEIPEPRQFESINVNVGETVIDMPEIFAPDFTADLAEAIQQGATYSGDSWRAETYADTYVVRIRKVDGKPTYFGVLHLV
jgi:hypothetical protein